MRHKNYAVIAFGHGPLRLKENIMSSTILIQLATIRDQLDADDEVICAARLQMVIDTLEARRTCGFTGLKA